MQRIIITSPFLYCEQSARPSMPIRIPSQIVVDCKSVHYVFGNQGHEMSSFCTLLSLQGLVPDLSALLSLQGLVGTIGCPSEFISRPRWGKGLVETIGQDFVHVGLIFLLCVFYLLRRHSVYSLVNRFQQGIFSLVGDQNKNKSKELNKSKSDSIFFSCRAQFQFIGGIFDQNMYWVLPYQTKITIPHPLYILPMILPIERY